MFDVNYILLFIAVIFLAASFFFMKCSMDDIEEVGVKTALRGLGLSNFMALMAIVLLIATMILAENKVEQSFIEPTLLQLDVNGEILIRDIEDLYIWRGYENGLIDNPSDYVTREEVRITSRLARMRKYD